MLLFTASYKKYGKRLSTTRGQKRKNGRLPIRSTTVEIKRRMYNVTTTELNTSFI